MTQEGKRGTGARDLGNEESRERGGVELPAGPLPAIPSDELSVVNNSSGTF